METEHIERMKSRISKLNIEDEFSCLRSICLSVTDMCNLQCEYCPHSTYFENANNYASLDMIHELKRQLSFYKYSGMISISGMGEPTLHPQINEIVEILQSFDLQIISNGLTNFDYRNIAKYACIVISIHDMNNEHIIKNNTSNVECIYRNHDIHSSVSEFSPTNRWNQDLDNTISSICYYPFYKTTIDYDGSYLICQEDWKRYSKKYTIFDIDIRKYFTEYLHSIKMMMFHHPRSISPCDKCNANGLVLGGEYAEYFKNKYNIGGGI